jgi:hypothetical protein
LSAVQKTIRKLRKAARKKRQDFLSLDEWILNAEATQTAEDLGRVCTKISQAANPHHLVGLTTVLIPVDNPNPKLATIWKKIDDPSAIHLKRILHWL